MTKKYKMIALGLFMATVVQSCSDNESTPNDSAISKVEKE